MLKALSSFIFHKIWGWKIEGEYPRDLKKMIIIVAPHTSNWDFPIGLMLRRIWKTDIKWVGKKSLFQFPIGGPARWLGGIAVNRKKNNNFVDSVIELYNNSSDLIIQMAPEGTRKKVNKFKTGFYRIAKGANLPILMIQFDYGNKKVVVNKPFYPTTDFDADMDLIQNYFRGIKGKYPEQSFL